LDDSSNKRTKNKSGNKRTDIIKKYIVPCVLLVILAVVVSWIAYYRIKIQMDVGPFWDTYAYLANALEFAGKGTGYYELDRPPLIPFLTSIAFRLGFMSETAIYVLDALLFSFGVIGLYLFFNMRFNSILSFSGALIYVSFPLVLAWMGVGYVDVAAVSLSIWALYLTVLAVQKDSKIFYLAFPIATMAMLSRYTAAFIIFPMALYILISGKYLKSFKNMLIGILISFLILVPFAIFSYIKMGDPFYSFYWSFQFNIIAPTEHFGYLPDPFFYLRNIGSYISAKGFFHYWIPYIFISIILIGVILYIYGVITAIRNKSKFRKRIYGTLKSKWEYKNIKLIIAVLLIVIFIATFNRVSYMISVFLFFVFCFSAYHGLKGILLEKFDLDLLFLSWFMTQFTVQSVFALKVDRYFITMTPALAYFVALGLNQISEKLKVEFKYINITAIFLSCIFIILAFSSTIVYLNDISHGKDDYLSNDFQKNKVLTEDIISTANWLKKYDPEYKNKEIRSDFWPAFVWYLKMNLEEMPSYNNSKEINHELEKNNIDYFLSLHQNLNLTSYTEINKIGNITIYKKNPKKFEIKPHILYIGKNWQHYVDNVLGFKAYVYYEGVGRFSIGRSTYIDDHSLSELKKYPYILLYNFRWQVI